MTLHLERIEWMPSPPLVPDDGPIDFEHLKRMTLGDAGLEQEVLAMFSAQAARLVKTLAAMPSDAAALKAMRIPGVPAAGPGGGLSPGVSLPPAPKKASPLDKITPVTDSMLANPPASEWLTWRRTFDYQGFSPLKQITKNNVTICAWPSPGRFRMAPTRPRRWFTMA